MTDSQRDFSNIYKIQKKYNSEEFFEFVKEKEERYELINGRIYLMASPNVGHQDIALFIGAELQHYLKGKTCRAFIAPLDVVLFEKSKENSHNVIQPDVFVVCDPEKISKERIYGAPDLAIEIVSPSSEIHDYFKKFGLYMKYGVKEYWIVNPETKTVFVQVNGQDENGNDNETVKYSFGDKIKVGIFDDFYIDFKEMQV
ncbi:MAG: Uma2 family endonuclease [Oscillospiraceae bacterium]|nr:Uma2 family endonuclease [Oscillospiraceae bacterium]